LFEAVAQVWQQAFRVIWTTQGWAAAVLVIPLVGTLLGAGVAVEEVPLVD